MHKLQQSLGITWVFYFTPLSQQTQVLQENLPPLIDANEPRIGVEDR